MAIRFRYLIPGFDDMFMRFSMNGVQEIAIAVNQHRNRPQTDHALKTKPDLSVKAEQQLKMSN